MKKNIKELPNEKEFMKHLRMPGELMADIAKLTALLVVFEVKYGVKIELVFDDKPKTK